MNHVYEFKKYIVYIMELHNEMTENVLQLVKKGYQLMQFC